MNKKQTTENDIKTIERIGETLKGDNALSVEMAVDAFRSAQSKAAVRWSTYFLVVFVSLMLTTVLVKFFPVAWAVITGLALNLTASLGYGQVTVRQHKRDFERYKEALDRWQAYNNENVDELVEKNIKQLQEEANASKSKKSTKRGTNN